MHAVHSIFLHCLSFMKPENFEVSVEILKCVLDFSLFTCIQRRGLFEQNRGLRGSSPDYCDLFFNTLNIFKLKPTLFLDASLLSPRFQCIYNVEDHCLS